MLGQRSMLGSHAQVHSQRWVTAASETTLYSPGSHNPLGERHSLRCTTRTHARRRYNLCCQVKVALYLYLVSRLLYRHSNSKQRYVFH